MQEGHPTPAAEPMLDLRGYLTVLRRRKWSILIITAVAVVAALAVSFQQTPIYESTAKVQVNPPTTDPLQTLPITSLVNMDTERQIAESTAVAEKAAVALGTDESPEELLEDLSVSVPTNSQVLEITFADPDPARAQAGAQAFAESYLAYKVERAQATVTRLTTALNEQLEDLTLELNRAKAALAEAGPNSPEAISAQSEIDVLSGQISDLKTQRAELRLIDLNPGEIFSEADLPTEPASPDHILNGGLALLLGLALGVGFAFLRERLDDRIAGREAFEEAIGGPTLAVVPRITAWRKRSRAELPALKAPKGAPAEAYRTVRTNLLFMARDGGIKTVAITSPASGEGKSTTAANLAVSLAQAEKRVIVMSCDLRKPRLHQYFNLNNDIGVSSVAQGKVTLRDAILKPVGAGTLRVIPSGPVPHNPAELLASDRMDMMLRQLRQVADFVIIDSPPTLAVSDGLTLAPKVDGVILVADAATTSRGAMRQLREQLEQVGGNILGGVFNNFDPARAKYYASYGTYYGSYPYEPEEGRRRKKEPEPAGPTPEDIWRTEDIWS